MTQTRVKRFSRGTSLPLSCPTIVERPVTNADRPITEERRVERRSRPSRNARRARRVEEEPDEDYEEVETTRRRL